MSLANLVKTGQLKEHEADAEELERLLAAAERGIADARANTVSLETRYDAAYRAITQIGLAALMDYTGQEVDEGSVTACAGEAEKLLREVRSKFGKRK